jgi:hypothetical protein
MSAYSYYQLGNEELEQMLNQAKDLVIDYLTQHDLITTDQTAEMLCKTTLVCIKKPSTITRLYNKVFNEENDCPRMIVVKSPILD